MLRDRVARAVDTWKAREVTSTRLLLTGAGILVLGVPLSLWYVVVGPAAGDRLVALAILAVSLLLGAYSLWEAKAPGPPERSVRDEDDT